MTINDEFEQAFSEVSPQPRPSKVDVILELLDEKSRASALQRLNDPDVATRTITNAFHRMAQRRGDPRFQVSRDAIDRWRKNHD